MENRFGPNAYKLLVYKEWHMFKDFFEKQKQHIKKATMYGPTDPSWQHEMKNM